MRFTITPIVQSRDPGTDAARALIDEYVARLGVDLSFQGLDAERVRFPAGYLPPDGVLLIAGTVAKAVGVVAVRCLDARFCEMKRLYVHPSVRGHGLGRRLAGAAMARAFALGYQRMRLDTLTSMQAARALYTSLGFEPIPPYYDNPLPGVVYLEAPLAAGSDTEPT